MPWAAKKGILITRFTASFLAFSLLSFSGGMLFSSVVMAQEDLALVDNQQADQKASDVVAQMRKLVQRVEKTLPKLLGDIKAKQFKLENVEKEFDDAIARLKKVAELAKPDGPFNQQIEELMKKGDEAIARLQNHRIEKLRKLVDLVYKPEMEKLQGYKNDINKFYGDILRKIRQIEENKEVTIELLRANLYQEAVALVGKAAEEYKGMDTELAKIEEQVSQSEEKLTASQ